MRQSPGRVDLGQDGIVRNPILHDAHPDDLMAASEELRERTMALEPRAPILGMWIATVLMSVVAVAAFGTFKFRDEIRAYFGLF